MARYFDGSDDKIDFGDATATEGITNLTISIWAYWYAISDFKVLFGKFSSGADGGIAVESSANGLGIGDNDDLIATVADNSGNYSYTNSNILSTGAWGHYLLRYNAAGAVDSDKTQLWFNGSNIGMGYSGSIPATTYANSQNLRIGASGDDARFSNIAAAEFAVWTVSLTVGEILALSKGASPLLVRPTGLWDYFPLTGRGSDEVGIKGNVGTVTGAVFHDHPRVYRSSRRRNRALVSAGGGATTTRQKICGGLADRGVLVGGSLVA